MWPDVRVKSSPISSKVAKNVDSIVLLEKWCFSRCPNSFPNIWTTFAIKVVAEKFQKSPNLVTLLATYKYTSNKETRVREREDESSYQREREISLNLKVQHLSCPSNWRLTTLVTSTLKDWIKSQFENEKSLAFAAPSFFNFVNQVGKFMFNVEFCAKLWSIFRHFN